MPFYSRKATRIKNYDYSAPNYYFITISTCEKTFLFGQPGQLNWIGNTVEKHIRNIPTYYKSVFIDKYVVMPNHVHMILVLCGNDNPPVQQIIGQFKTGVTKEIRIREPGMEVWQRSFHDHIIRSQKGYEKIWLYIEDNPRKWEEDCFHPKNWTR